ncbi:MAG TPA: hypothetical protein PKE06_02450 [Flavilitoribacter sp.]|nr:hypothetical protein [Flavilitoribacter sp.]HMQ87514.1 hypothetical protein [Flavilitoribacter sp.]
MAVTVEDTIYQQPLYNWDRLSVFDKKTSDSIVKYQYQSSQPSFARFIFHNLNLALIDTDSGKILASYTFHQNGAVFGTKSVDRVLKDFVRRLGEKSGSSEK